MRWLKYFLILFLIFETNGLFGRTENPGGGDNPNCTDASLSDFPTAFLPLEQRQKGGVVLHLVLALYLFVLIALVCDGYFLPSVECICEDLKISADVAGATFMALATAAPELFMTLLGTFVTETDIGVGTIMGSAVFNMLGIAACTGLAAVQVIRVDWWPVTRDCSIYMVAKAALTGVLWDSQVEWWEALLLTIGLLLYLLLMYCDPRLQQAVKSIASKNLEADMSEGTYRPHLQSISIVSAVMLSDSNTSSEEDIKAPKPRRLPWHPPRSGGPGARAWWALKLPLATALWLTVPDCRRSRHRRLYPLTFCMCIVWIGAAAYVVTWMITVIGDTLRIPDSVMGLTLLAVGGSLPEMISCIIMARHGEGAMGMSNTLGANSLSVLMCLGVPWLVSALVSGAPVLIVSTNIRYMCSALMLATLLYFGVLACFRFRIGKRLGCTFLACHLLYLVLAVLLEIVFLPSKGITCGWT